MRERLPASGIPPDQQTAFAITLDPCWTRGRRFVCSFQTAIALSIGARDPQQVLYAAFVTLASAGHLVVLRLEWTNREHMTAFKAGIPRKLVDNFRDLQILKHNQSYG